MFESWSALGKMMFRKNSELSPQQRGDLLEKSASPLILMVFLCAVLYQLEGYGLVLNTISIWTLIIIVGVAFERGVRIQNA